MLSCCAGTPSSSSWRPGPNNSSSSRPSLALTSSSSGSLLGSGNAGVPSHFTPFKTLSVFVPSREAKDVMARLLSLIVLLSTSRDRKGVRGNREVSRVSTASRSAGVMQETRERSRARTHRPGEEYGIRRRESQAWSDARSICVNDLSACGVLKCG